MKKLKLVIFISIFLFPNITELDAQEGSDSFKEFVEKHFGNNYLITDSIRLDTSKYNNIDKSEIIRFHKLLKHIIDDEPNQKKLHGKAKFDLNTNHAGDNSQYRLGAGFDLNIGEFPERLEVASDVQVTLNNGVLVDEVSNLVVSYDLALQDWVDSYGFVRRHSDNYMSVDQRYELGVGLVVGGRWNKTKDLHLNDKVQRKIIEKSLFKKIQYDSIQFISDKIEQQRRLAENAEWQRRKMVQVGSPDRYEGVRLAFLVGFNGEIEQNTLRETFNAPVSIDSILRENQFVRTDTSFRSQQLTRTLPSDFIWRLVLRPTASWHTNHITVSWIAYVKPPLLFWKKNDRRIEEDEPLDMTLNPIRGIQRGTDWRLENRISLMIDNGPVRTELSYEYYYDNFPASAYLSPREPSIIKNVHLFEAEKHHHIVRLNLSYNFR